MASKKSAAAAAPAVSEPPSAPAGAADTLAPKAPGEAAVGPAPALPFRRPVDMDAVLSHHAPDEEQLERIARLRLAGKAYAQIVLELTPQCADQTAALRHLADCQMTAVRAVILRGLW